MKLINRKEFLKMPTNTIFSYWVQDKFMEWEGFNRLFDTYGNDFTYASILDNIYYEYNKGKDHMDNLVEIEKKLLGGKSVDIDTDMGERDGCYVEDEKYIIYEENDIKKIIKTLEAFLQSNKQQGSIEDPNDTNTRGTLGMN